MSAFSPNQRAVLDAVELMDPGRGARQPAVARAAGLPPKKAARCVAALVQRGVLVRQASGRISVVGSPDPQTKEEPMAQQEEVFEYVTKPEGKVHLQRQRPEITSTLCGRDAASGCSARSAPPRR